MIGCDSCKYSDTPRTKESKRTCECFPDGIPQDILEGIPHDKVRPEQDNDIVYEVIDYKK